MLSICRIAQAHPMKMRRLASDSIVMGLEKMSLKEDRGMSSVR